VSIPDYQAIMLPFMRALADGEEHSLGELIDSLASEFGLTDQERNELLPSGSQLRFANRVGWAGTYLKKAGLLERAGRGRLRITRRGLQLLKEKPRAITKKFLMQFPEFVEFQRISHTTENSGKAEDVALRETPEEMLESSYQNLRSELAQRLLEQVKSCSPRFFERLVVDLLVAMGYGGSKKDAETVGRTGDGGSTELSRRIGSGWTWSMYKRRGGSLQLADLWCRLSLEVWKGGARKGVMITT